MITFYFLLPPPPPPMLIRIQMKHDADLDPDPHNNACGSETLEVYFAFPLPEAGLLCDVGEGEQAGVVRYEDKVCVTITLDPQCLA